MSIFHPFVLREMRQTFVLALFALCAVAADSDPGLATNVVPVRADESGEDAFVPKHSGKVRFALCQTPSVFSKTETRIEFLFSWARRRLHGDEDVIVFPELAFSAFSDLSTAWRKAPAVWEAAAAFARERGAYLFVNHPHRPDGADGSLFNETRVFAPDGTVAFVYRKRVLSRMDEKALFLPGPPATMAQLPFGRIGVLICKDAFTPSEGSDRYASADVLLVQFAHPGVDNIRAPEARWFPPSGKAMSEVVESRFGWARFGKPYLAVNKTGPDGNYVLSGGSFASDASGRIVKPLKRLPDVFFTDFPLGPDGAILPNGISSAAPAVECER